MYRKPLPIYMYTQIHEITGCADADRRPRFKGMPWSSPATLVLQAQPLIIVINAIHDCMKVHQCLEATFILVEFKNKYFII